MKLHLSEKDIAVYHVNKFRKKHIDLELVDFITPYGYATLGELREAGFECELSGGLKNYKPKDDHWYRITKHGLEFDKSKLNQKQKEFREFSGLEPEECMDELEELEE